MLVLKLDQLFLYSFIIMFFYFKPTVKYYYFDADKRYIDVMFLYQWKLCTIENSKMLEHKI